MKTEQDLIPYYNANPNHSTHRPAMVMGVIRRLKIPFLDVEWLDLGCSRGAWLEYLSPLIHSGVGVDFSSVRLDIACQALQLHDNIELYMRSIQEQLILDDCFDVISMWEVLEHLEKPEEVIAACKEKAEYVVASTPISMPDPAHIQVWTQEEILDRLKPDRYEVPDSGKWIILVWES